MKLKIKGTNYPIEWGMGCLEMFCDALSCELVDIDKALFPGPEQIKFMTTLFLCAIKQGADKESYFDDFEVSYKDVQRFIDSAPEGTTASIIDDFNKSKYFGRTMSEYLFNTVKDDSTDEEAKKK